VSADRSRTCALRFGVGTCAGCVRWTPGSTGTAYYGAGRADLGTCAVHGNEWPGWFTACTVWAPRDGSRTETKRVQTGAADPRRAAAADPDDFTTNDHNGDHNTEDFTRAR